MPRGQGKKIYTAGDRVSAYIGKKVPRQVVEWINLQDDISESMMKAIINQIRTQGMTNISCPQPDLDDDFITPIAPQVRQAPVTYVEQRPVTPEPIMTNAKVVNESHQHEAINQNKSTVIPESQTAHDESSNQEKWAGLEISDDDPY